jgi:Uma2 family endonuclease
MADKLHLTTAEEFLKLLETTTPMELHNGEVIIGKSRWVRHQKVGGNIHFLLHNIIPNGELHLSLLDVRFDEWNVVQPDIFWVVPDGKCREVNGKYLDGAPDLVIEIIAEDTVVFDRGFKYHLYEKYGVREYWMVDPHEDYIEVVVLENEQFKRLGIFSPSETFNSPVIGKTVEVSRIFAK